MQAAYALTRLILFGFGWSIAAGLALAADELLPGVKWPVLAILAALLLLALGKAKAAAQATACLSNFKQLTIAWTMYTVDNKEFR